MVAVVAVPIRVQTTFNTTESTVTPTVDVEGVVAVGLEDTFRALQCPTVQAFSPTAEVPLKHSSPKRMPPTGTEPAPDVEPPLTVVLPPKNVAQTTSVARMKPVLVAVTIEGAKANIER
jgi:hypothetical protein